MSGGKRVTGRLDVTCSNVVLATSMIMVVAMAALCIHDTLYASVAYAEADSAPALIHESFDTKWTVTEDDKTISILVRSATDEYTIDWGDGNSDTYTYRYSNPHFHTYDDAGTYLVKISGGVTSLYLDHSVNAAKLASIEQWGTIKWTNMRHMFWQASNMMYGATDVPDLSQVTDMTAMFSGASAFNGDISDWDVSSVTDMTAMFAKASSFNQPLNSWDVSSVTDMTAMFAKASSFNQPLNSWDVSGVTNMNGMFHEASSFNQPLNSWDVSSVTDMTWMFHEASSFNQPLNSWDVSSVTKMSKMFYNADSFNQPLNSWDVSSVTDMTAMFSGASSFNQPLNSWDVSSVTDMTAMFAKASSFNQPLNSWDVSSVTDMESMFAMSHLFGHTSSFNQPLNSWDVSSVTKMSKMFYNADSFNQPLNSWDVSSVTDMTAMFSGASSFNQPLNSWDVSSVTDMSKMFSEASSFNQPLNSWDITGVTNTSSMFAEASSFNQPLNSWDVSGVTTMAWMFLLSSSFNQPLNSWDVSSVTDMFSMFDGASSFNQPLNSWDVSSVTKMSEMFKNAGSFNQPLNSWDVSSVTDMRWMFDGASSFNQPLNSWDVSSVTDMSWMFDDATSFSQNLGEWYIVPDSTVVESGQTAVATIETQNHNLDGHNPTYGIAPRGDGHLFEMRGNILQSASAEYQKRFYDVTVTSTGGFSSPNSRDITITVLGEISQPPPDPSAPEIRHASITGPHHVTVRFSEPMTATLDSFAGIALSGEDRPRAFTALAGSGTPEFTLVLGGPPTPPDATAVMSIAGGIIDSDGNLLASPDTVEVYDGQAPVLHDVSMSSTGGQSAMQGDTVMLEFTASETVTNVRADINGKAVTPSSTGNSWSASKKVNFLDPAGDMEFAIDFTDMAGNPGTRATVTTDGSRVSVARDTVTSEGVAAISSDRANAAGYTGKGVNVAVLDQGFVLTSPEIARNIAEFKSFGGGPNRDHATAAAEVITDIAPDVNLYLYSYWAYTDYLRIVDYLISRGNIDIALSSANWTYAVGLPDGTSRVTQKIDEAHDSGMLWINSVGNRAESHWQGMFHDPDNDGWHNFEGDDETMDVYTRGSSGGAILIWDLPSEDYDLCAIGDDGVEKWCSDNLQPGFDPIETAYGPANYSNKVLIAIKRHSGAGDAMLHLSAISPVVDSLEYHVPTSSIMIPADADGSFTVGATHWKTGELDPSSSQGPTLDGRTKPDIVAPTRVSTAVYGPVGFAITSASAAHAAGAAALVMEKYPNATPDQARWLLESTATDRHPKSNQDGTGRLDVSMLAKGEIIADAGDPSCAPTGACFFPGTLAVPVGGTATWVNAGTVPVRITGPGIDSGSLARGESYAATLGSAGTIEYSDALHPWATGQLDVVPDTTPPAILAAEIAAPNRARITFSEDVVVREGSFSGIMISGEPSARTVTAASGSGTDIIVLEFDGPPTQVGATGTISVGSGIRDTYGNEYAEPLLVDASDGQIPTLGAVSITSSGPNAKSASPGDAITLQFDASELIRGATVTIGGIDAVLSSTGAHSWNATRTITESDPAGAVAFSIYYEDMAGNPGSRATATTDGTLVHVVEPPAPGKAAVQGRVCIDINDDGACSTDEQAPESPFDRMYLVPPGDSGLTFDGKPYRTAIASADGVYRFDDVIPDMEWIIQTLYFPPGHTVPDPNSSWFMRVVPEEGQTIPFDVGFYPVPEPDQVRLDITAYHDINENGARDADEGPVQGVNIDVYTYVTAQSRILTTGDNGTASAGFVPADLLVQVVLPDGYSRITSPVLVHPDYTVPGAMVVDDPGRGDIVPVMVGLAGTR